MVVKDFMIRDVYVIEQSEHIKTVLELMVEKRIGGVPVVNEDNKLVGIITDGDILRALNPKTYHMGYNFSYTDDLDESIVGNANQTIKHAMHKKVIAAHENASLESVLKVLSQHHFKKIPVINEDNEVVGIVSRGDMIKKLREKLLENIN